MAQTLSQDLRDRVVAAIDSGLSCRAAAARFGVSVSSAIRWRQRALAHGQAVAKPRGGDRHSGKIEAHGCFIRVRRCWLGAGDEEEAGQQDDVFHG